MLSARAWIIAMVMDTPTITYVAAYATAATALGTAILAGATYWLARKTKDTAEAARADLAQSVEQGKAIARQTDAMIEQTTAVSEQADAVKRQSEATAQQVELLKAQADAARRQSDAAEAALNASVQPLLVDVPYGTILRVPPSMQRTAQATRKGQPIQASELDASSIYWDIAEHRTMLSFRVQNIGAGAGRLQRSVVTNARDLSPSFSVRVERSTVVAPGQFALLVFSSNDEPEDEQGSLQRLLESQEQLLVEIAYTDIAGRQGAATRLYLQPGEARGDAKRIYRVSRVDPLVAPRFTRLD